MHFCLFSSQHEPDHRNVQYFFFFSNQHCVRMYLGFFLNVFPHDSCLFFGNRTIFVLIYLLCCSYLRYCSCCSIVVCSLLEPVWGRKGSILNYVCNFQWNQIQINYLCCLQREFIELYVEIVLFCTTFNIIQFLITLTVSSFVLKEKQTF